MWGGSRIASSDLTMPTPPPDTRPRHPYALPDGREIRVIADHGDVPKDVIDFELATGDPLWSKAKTRPGTQRRFVVARLKKGCLDPAEVDRLATIVVDLERVVARLQGKGASKADAAKIAEECRCAIVGVLEAARW